MRSIAIIITLFFAWLGSGQAVAQTWSKLNGPFTGNLSDVAVCPSNGHLVFTVGASGTFKSTDAGTTWQKVGADNCNFVAVSASDANHIITDKTRSSDGGTTWDTLTTPTSADVMFAYGSDSVVYSTSAVGDTVNRSTDFGTTWTAIDDSAGLYGNCLALLSSNSADVLYAITSFGYVNRTYDGGITWSRIPFANYFPDTLVACLSPANSQSITIITQDSMYRSMNGGTTFSSIKNSVSYNLSSLVPDWNDSSTFYLFDGSSSNGHVFKTTNSGNSWTVSYGNYLNGKILRSSPDGAVYVATAESGLLKAANQGQIWKSIGPVTDVPVGMIVLSDMAMYSWDYYTVYKTTDGGNTWTVIHDSPAEDKYELAVSAQNTSKLYVAMSDSLALSADGGASWKGLASSNVPYGVFVSPLSDSMIIVAGSIGVSGSTNGGTSWSKITLPSRADGLLWSTVNQNTLFSYAPNAFNKSTDAGSTWSPVNIPIDTTDYIWDAEASRTGTIYIGAYVVLKSTDNGTTFSKVYDWTASANNWFITNITIDPTNDQKLYAASSNILIGSSDGGATWLSATPALPSPPNFAAVSPSGKVFASTANGIYYAGVQLTGVRIVSSRIPSKFELDQNYPNPFNPTTTINYAIPTRSHVTLSVFNTLGQKVIELVNGEKDAGSYSIAFKAAGLASGVYLYRIQAGSFVQTKKLVVVK